MAEPRKVFRIEQTAAVRSDAHSDDPQALRHAEIMHELSALRAMLAAAPAGPGTRANGARHAEIERLISELHVIHAGLSGTARQHAERNGTRLPAAPATLIANELEAVMKGGEQATEKILAAAEEIDQAANNLSAALKDETEQELAQDIRDRVIQIFEACNFQDLTSQRVAKVMATLSRIEEQISGTLDELAHVEAAPSVRGPRLESEHGHASQSDIDSLFGSGGQSG
jgi:chemotaxis protein CheZ